jgi:hypothetical protein
MRSELMLMSCRLELLSMILNRSNRVSSFSNNLSTMKKEKTHAAQNLTRQRFETVRVSLLNNAFTRLCYSRCQR